MFPQIFIDLNKFFLNIGFSTYDLFIGIGLIIMYRYFIFVFEKRMNYSKEKTNKLLVILSISLVVSYLSAAFFDAFYHYLEDGLFTGGITYISGFIGGIISFIILIKYFMKEERKNIIQMLNLIIPGIILAHAFGRIGCFSVGSCYGKPTDSLFGVYFPEGTNPYIDGIRTPIHPTQLYESTFLFLLFIPIEFINKIKNYKFSIYLISYGIFRFILETYFRGDSRGLLFGAPPSQILSVTLLLSGIILLIYQLYNKLDFENNEV